MTSQVRHQLIASGNIKPAARVATVKADPTAIRARFNELNKRKTESAVAILKAASLRHD